MTYRIAAAASRNLQHLLRRVLDKLDALLDVALETLVAGLEQLLFVLVGVLDDINGLLGTAGTELDGDGEVLAAGDLLDLVTAVDAREVDERGLDDAGFAVEGFDELLGEAVIVRQ